MGIGDILDPTKPSPNGPAHRPTLIEIDEERVHERGARSRQLVCWVVDGEGGLVG